jgi:hypothetical protein
MASLPRRVCTVHPSSERVGPGTAVDATAQAGAVRAVAAAISTAGRSHCRLLARAKTRHIRRYASTLPRGGVEAIDASSRPRRAGNARWRRLLPVQRRKGCAALSWASCAGAHGSAPISPCSPTSTRRSAWNERRVPAGWNQPVKLGCAGTGGAGGGSIDGWLDWRRPHVVRIALSS